MTILKRWYKRLMLNVWTVKVIFRIIGLNRGKYCLYDVPYTVLRMLTYTFSKFEIFDNDDQQIKNVVDCELNIRNQRKKTCGKILTIIHHKRTQPSSITPF